MSCDLLPTEAPGPHFEGDLFDLLSVASFDLIIAHPPCTHLAVSGNRWYAGTKEREQAIRFVESIWSANCPRICIENPVGVLSTNSCLGKPTQYVHPWWFGHEASKKTGLWLKGLPKLEPTNIVSRGEYHTTKSGRRLPKWYNLPPSEDRWKIRSKTFTGLAQAMADQWG